MTGRPSTTITDPGGVWTATEMRAGNAAVDRYLRGSGPLPTDAQRAQRRAYRRAQRVRRAGPTGPSVHYSADPAGRCQRCGRIWPRGGLCAPLTADPALCGGCGRPVRSPQRGRGAAVLAEAESAPDVGLTPFEVARALGLQVTSVARTLRRLGRPDLAVTYERAEGSAARRARRGAGSRHWQDVPA